MERIAEIEETDKNSGRKPEAQKILAQEITRTVHGQEGLDAAERIATALFGGDVKDLNEGELDQLGLDGLPRFDLKSETALVDALIGSGLAQSKRAAREFIGNKAVRLNSEAFAGEADYVIQESDLLHGRYLVLQRGKKAHALLVAV